MPAWLLSVALFLAPQENVLADLEVRSGGRLGVRVESASGEVLLTHRASERFPLCSTFKLLLVGAVLRKIDQGAWTLEGRMPVTRKDLVAHSPRTEAVCTRGFMTVEEACAAVLQVSDNAAANLLLKRFGGPKGLTSQLRRLGDGVTRLDRWEPALNEARPGDRRDTSTPEAVVALLRRLLVGPTLTPRSQDLLRRWMAGSETGLNRLKAGFPPAWQVFGKTGTGARGTTNDVALVVLPDGRTLLVAAYLTGAQGSLEDREGILAAVARHTVTMLQPTR